ncbi:hypothetical protein SAMN02745751_00402 [Dethiosulfatibacter aminovorans DSM 17477]|uniref:DUF917 family protein n=1 Tax=Dethiosulfatibacter aminovorans DSM 17477 TaxID=1121476 RepID=A0A1M6BLY6_9FIRM|nr:DUF917 family protein [Dethiosulfatibacter aminovorans]SHI49667.1 hypothetical protein SAMN02745751_00402 [Dethiosulfatibacter aminovorans DSM 17477]
MYKIDNIKGKCAVRGGSFLGGGGGGSENEGIRTLEEALKFGDIIVKGIDEFEDDDIIVTASAVGSPASKEGYVSVEQVVDNFNLFKMLYGKEIKGIITNENGGHSTTNGWILSAATGIPLVDAPCNGRAHPTGVMGSMGLESRKDYLTVQTAAGGKDEKAIATYVKGKMDSAAKMVRQTAVEAGGLVTVLRNPVEADYVKKNAAIGSLAMAVEIGEIFEEYDDCKGITDKLNERYNLETIAYGKVIDCSLTIEGGFDHGHVTIGDGNDEFKVTFWNEFMTIDKEGVRLATFPDLIGLIDSKTTEILTSATVKEGDEVCLYRIPKENLILGSGMKNREQLRLVEKVLNTEIVKFIEE